MPDDMKNAADDADLMNEPVENTAVDPMIDPVHDNGTPNDIEEKVKSFFHDNPLVVALHNLLSGHKVKNDDGSYTIKAADEHVGAAHDALADATKT